MLTNQCRRSAGNLFLFLDKSANAFIRFEIIAKRLSYNTWSGLYEKLRKGRFLTVFNFLAATQKVACYRFLHILTESDPNYFQRIGEK